MFDEIELLESEVSSCQVKENECEVNGTYRAIAKTEKSVLVLEGSFQVGLIVSELGYWDMKNIQICGFNP